MLISESTCCVSDLELTKHEKKKVLQIARFDFVNRKPVFSVSWAERYINFNLTRFVLNSWDTWSNRRKRFTNLTIGHENLINNYSDESTSP